MFSVFSSYILFFVSAFDFFFFTSHPRYTTRHAPHAFISSYLYVYIPLLPFLTTPQDFFFYMFSMCVFFLNFFLVKLAFSFFFDCDSLLPSSMIPFRLVHTRISVSRITSYPRLESYASHSLARSVFLGPSDPGSTLSTHVLVSLVTLCLLRRRRGSIYIY